MIHVCLKYKMKMNAKNYNEEDSVAIIFLNLFLKSLLHNF